MIWIIAWFRREENIRLFSVKKFLLQLQNEFIYETEYREGCNVLSVSSDRTYL